MAKTLTYESTLVVTSCWCGIGLAIPQDLYDAAHIRQTSIYCPVGHTFVYGNTEIEQLKAELESKRTTIKQWANDYQRVYQEKQSVERSLSATKAVVTRTKNRLMRGVCPCCNRSFEQLARHMAHKHPDYTNEAAAS